MTRVEQEQLIARLMAMPVEDEPETEGWMARLRNLTMPPHISTERYLGDTAMWRRLVGL